MEWLRQALGDGESEEEEGGEDGMEEDEPLLPRDDGSSSSSEAEEGGSGEPRPGAGAGCSQFDVSLPARHLYLGDLQEEEQVAMEDEETTPTLPMLCLANRVLFPGEILPMHIYNSHAIEMLRDAATRHKPVAIVTDFRKNSQIRQMMRPTMKDLSRVGTTAEVMAMREEDELDTQYWDPSLVIKFLGRQRFRLLEIFKRSNGMSVDGPVASYVNPGGYVHDTLTAKEVENIRVHGPSSTVHSWFPGYSWTMLACKECKRHKGWLFKATRRDLSPREFYGLTRQGLEHKPSGATGVGDQSEGQGSRTQPCTPS